jgi:hypothetical protein
VNFNSLVKNIEDKGCDVILLNESEVPGEECDGTFDVIGGRPTITLALKYKSQNRLRYILLHELAHYYQWVDGFMQSLDGYANGWEIFDKWLKGGRCSRKKLWRARNSVLFIEYDADMRVIGLAKDFGIRLNKARHIAEANAYADLIKWAFKHRKWKHLPDVGNYPRKAYSPRDLLGPLEEKRNALLNGLVD